MNASLTIPSIRQHKVHNGKKPLVMLTAYDAPSAKIADEAGVDILLVGDTLAMVVLGYEDTLQLDVADMVHHTAAVARAKPSAVIVADLPWLSYHISKSETITNAAQLIRAGAQAVKLEGGRKRLPMVEALINAEIPVMGHIGLTPQSIHSMGGFRVQARTAEEAQDLLSSAKALEHAGCFAVVIEGVPAPVAEMVTDELDIPTIGIGAGIGCDGQVLVYHDMLGLQRELRPKFVRHYADLYKETVEAVRNFAADVRAGSFPAATESYGLDKEAAATLKRSGKSG